MLFANLHGRGMFAHSLSFSHSLLVQWQGSFLLRGAEGLPRCGRPRWRTTCPGQDHVVSGLAKVAGGTMPRCGTATCRAALLEAWGAVCCDVGLGFAATKRWSRHAGLHWRWCPWGAMPAYGHIENAEHGGCSSNIPISPARRRTIILSVTFRDTSTWLILGTDGSQCFNEGNAAKQWCFGIDSRRNSVCRCCRHPAQDEAAGLLLFTGGLRRIFAIKERAPRCRTLLCINHCNFAKQSSKTLGPVRPFSPLGVLVHNSQVNRVQAKASQVGAQCLHSLVKLQCGVVGAQELNQANTLKLVRA